MAGAAAVSTSRSTPPGPSFCPRFHAAVELIGRRWTGAIVQTLMQGRVRYATLRQTIPDISDRMLSARLKELEHEDLVRRIVTPDTPVRVEYELTRKGRALHEALHAISAWAEQWIPAPGAQPGEPAQAAAPRRRRPDVRRRK